MRLCQRRVLHSSVLLASHAGEGVGVGELLLQDEYSQGRGSCRASLGWGGGNVWEAQLCVGDNDGLGGLPQKRQPSLCL